MIFLFQIYALFVSMMIYNQIKFIYNNNTYYECKKFEYDFEEYIPSLSIDNLPKDVTDY